MAAVGEVENTNRTRIRHDAQVFPAGGARDFGGCHPMPLGSEAPDRQGGHGRFPGVHGGTHHEKGSWPRVAEGRSWSEGIPVEVQGVPFLINEPSDPFQAGWVEHLLVLTVNFSTDPSLPQEVAVRPGGDGVTFVLIGGVAMAEDAGDQVPWEDRHPPPFRRLHFLVFADGSNPSQNDSPRVRL